MSNKEFEEYAVAYTSGDMKILSDNPVINDIYPLKDRIRAAINQGHEIYKRKVIVVKDWVEYELPD